MLSSDSQSLTASLPWTFWCFYSVGSTPLFAYLFTFASSQSFTSFPQFKAFIHWVLFTKRKLFGHFFPACWYRILTSSENHGRIRHASSLFVVVAASKNWLSSYFSRKKLSQFVVSQAVFILLVIMQIIWKLVGKRFRARHRQSWLDPHRTFALGHCQQKQSYSRLRSPGRSNSTYLWNGSCWVQIFHKLKLLCDF